MNKKSRVSVVRELNILLGETSNKYAQKQRYNRLGDKNHGESKALW